MTDDAMTHKERWYRMGWIVRWEDRERSYIACREQCSGDLDADSWHFCKTIADVDEWIAKHQRRAT